MYRRYAAHAASVESGIVLTYSLVVFSFWQYLVVLAIGEDEYLALDAAKELLDYDIGRGVAEHSAEHLPKLLLGLVEGWYN